MQKAGEFVKRFYLNKFSLMVKESKARIAIPFAGQYILGGADYMLNARLRVSDACDAAKLHKNAIVLDTLASIDTDELTPSSVRVEPFALDLLLDYSKSLENIPYDHERIDADC